MPISPYGVSKLAAERYVDVYCRLYDVRGASARLFSAYGPRQKKQIVYDFLEKLRADPTRLEIYGDGSQTRDLCYVADTVSALLLIAQEGSLKGEAYNVASGKTYSVSELATTIAALLGLIPELNYTGSVRPGDAEKWAVNSDRLTELGYKPQVSLEIGLTRTIEWHRDCRAAREHVPGPGATCA